MDDTAGHGECGDTGCADHRIDLLLGEDVDQLGEQNAAGGIILSMFGG